MLIVPDPATPFESFALTLMRYVPNDSAGEIATTPDSLICIPTTEVESEDLTIFQLENPPEPPDIDTEALAP